MEDKKPILTTVSDTLATTPTESYSEIRNMERTLSPLAPSYQSLVGNDLMSLLAQPEPRIADNAPATTSIDEQMMNLRINGPEVFDEGDQNTHNYYMGAGPPSESLTSNAWANGPTTSTSNARNEDMMDTFDFLVKSLSSANNFVSMLTREQLYVLRGIRPSVLYEFLREVAKVRNEKRMRRAAPNECAFCKNNGENEECYSMHPLKDWRGRVLCPVLRAFRCPRCGATGDHAHTIKYCPESADGLERSGSFGARRRMGPSSFLFGTNGSQALAAPAPSRSPSTASLSHSSLWDTFGLN